jgi:DNA polymerase-4
LFRHNWQAGMTVRLLGVHVSGWAEGGEQMDLLGEDRHEKWKQALAAADKLRDKFGESAVSLAAGMRGKFRERTHENPAGLPGKK